MNLIEIKLARGSNQWKSSQRSNAGTMKSFLDREFYISLSNGNFFRHKVGAAFNGGATFGRLVFTGHPESEMMLATSSYWNIIHGTSPGEAVHDAEGVQIMETLGENMPWQLKMREATKDNVPAPYKKS